MSESPEQPPANWLARQFEQNQFAALSLLCGIVSCLFGAAQAGIFAIGMGIAAVCCGSYGVEYARRLREGAPDPDAVPTGSRTAATGFALGLLGLAIYMLRATVF